MPPMNITGWLWLTTALGAGIGLGGVFKCLLGLVFKCAGC